MLGNADAATAAALVMLSINEGKLDGRPDGELQGKAFLSRLFGPSHRTKEGMVPNKGMKAFEKWVEKKFGEGSFDQVASNPALLSRALVDFASDPTVGGPSQRGGGGRDGNALGAQAKVREFLADGGLEQDSIGQWSLDPTEYGDTLKNGFDGDAIRNNPYWSQLLQQNRRKDEPQKKVRNLGVF